MRTHNPFIVPALLCFAVAATAGNATAPRTPVEVRLDTPRVVAATDHAPVHLTLIPSQDCEEFTTYVYGLDGIVIKSSRRKHDICRRGVPVTLETIARVPAGVLGTVVVSVGFVQNGESHGGTFAFPLGTPDGKRHVMADGIPVIDARGQGFIHHGSTSVIPVSVHLDTPGEVEPTDNAPIQVTVTPPTNCRSFTTRISGIDGIEIDTPQQHKHEVCRTRVGVTDHAVARVLPGVHGFVVVDVEFDVEVDVKDKHYARTFKLPMAASGADAGAGKQKLQCQ